MNEQEQWHGHTLICGVTESGKTTLAHCLAQFDKEEKKQIIVYDPVLTPTLAGEWPDGALIYTDEEKFLHAMGRRGNTETAVYVDEGADVFSHRQHENRWIMTRGRHYGYRVTLVSQRPKLIMPSVRHQCSRCFCFRLAQSDLKEISEDFGHSGLKNIPLDNGDFVVLYSGHAQVMRANVFLLVNRPRGTEWNTILNPPLPRSSSSPSSGASTRSGKPSQVKARQFADRPPPKPSE